MLSERDFRISIKGLPNKIRSKSGDASYTDFNLDGDILHFTRVNTARSWKLDVKWLYNIYRTNKFITTAVIKRITKGRVNSPSVAVLMAIGCLDNDGNRKD